MSFNDIGVRIPFVQRSLLETPPFFQKLFFPPQNTPQTTYTQYEMYTPPSDIPTFFPREITKLARTIPPEIARDKKRKPARIQQLWEDYSHFRYQPQDSKQQNHNNHVANKTRILRIKEHYFDFSRFVDAKEYEKNKKQKQI